MPGIQLNQIDTASFSKFFAVKADVKKEFFDTRKEVFDEICIAYKLTTNKTDLEYTIEHNKDMEDIQLSLVNLTTKEVTYPTFIIQDSNHVKIRFSEAVEADFKLLITFHKNIIEED